MELLTSIDMIALSVPLNGFSNNVHDWAFDEDIAFSSIEWIPSSTGLAFCRTFTSYFQFH